MWVEVVAVVFVTVKVSDICLLTLPGLLLLIGYDFVRGSLTWLRLIREQ